MRLSIFLLPLVVLFGCSSNVQLSEQQHRAWTVAQFESFIKKEQLRQVDQVTFLKIKNYQVFDDQYIAISDQNDKLYLLNTNESCSQMYFAKKIRLITNEKNKLNRLTDKVTRVGDHYTPCKIEKMYKLFPSQARQLSEDAYEIRNYSDLLINK